MLASFRSTRKNICLRCVKTCSAQFLTTHLHTVTSRHQSARGDGKKNKKSLKIVMFGSQESHQDRPQAGFKKDNTLNMQEFRPGCSAMQRHCGLRLFFKNRSTVTWSVVLRPLLSFFLTNGPRMTLLFRVVWSKSSFIFFLKNGPVYPTWFDRVNAWSIFFFSAF